MRHRGDQHRIAIFCRVLKQRGTAIESTYLARLTRAYNLYKVIPVRGLLEIDILSDSFTVQCSLAL